jgi:photosystem II stability/assembly factor-like uncharacterized protein
LQKLKLILNSCANNQFIFKAYFNRIKKKQLMKKIILLAILIISNFCYAQQWDVIYANEGQTLNDIQFVTDDLGYVLGFDTSAFLLKTTDGAQSWQRFPIPNSFALKLYFLNENLGYVITSGTPNKLYRTENGGAIWQIFNLDSAYFISGMAFKNEEDGFYMNNEGRLRGITNSGLTYSYISNSFPGNGAVIFTDENNGYIESSIGLNKTTDGGNNWIFIDVNGYPYNNDAISFSSTNIGYMSVSLDIPHQGKIIKTTDGGFNWEEKALYEAKSITSLDDVCLAVRDTGNIVFSGDAGENWTEEFLGTLYYGSETYKCALTPSKEAYLIDGFPGRIYKRNGAITALNEKTIHLKNSIYPNPAIDEIFIDLNNNHDKITIIILNTLGQTVLKQSYNKPLNSIDIKNLLNGIYTLQIFSNGKYLGSEKLVKN